jgi:prepilin-type processing-associated H-X9-DG protein
MDERTGLRFARPDLLVGLVLAALAALLIVPMIQSSRASARRTHCTSNLRQIGVALQAYFETNQSYPCAARWAPADLPLERQELQPNTAHATHENWVQLLLPNLGEQALWDSFDHSVPITEQRNQGARSTELAILKCPDDPYNRPDNHYLYEDTSRGIIAAFARGNYAINGGSQSVDRYPGYDAFPSPDGYHYVFDANNREFQVWGNGVAGINKAFRRDDIKNGLATLVAVNEVRAGIHPVDPRGVWGLGQLGGSITFGHGVTGDDAGPNNQGERADDVLGCGKLHKILGSDVIASERMPCCNYWELNLQATSRSMHDGGVNALMMDGSARFISDAIDPSLWHVMHSRETPPGVIREHSISATDVSNEKASTKQDSPAIGHLPSAPETHGHERASARLVNSIGMELMLIGTGGFTMGVPDVGNQQLVPSECPPHLVRITKPYYLGVYEVTQEQYERVMGKNPSWHTTSSGLADKPAQETALLPVEQVSWEDATEFCRRLSELAAEKEAGLDYRLPTEAEWEYACRSGRSEPFRWASEGNPRDGYNAGENLKRTLPVTAVGSYSPNEFGLYDMRGNVYEWCADWFARDYYARSPVYDPRGPKSGYLRVVRGGDWIFVGEGCPINRRIGSPWHFSRFVGFRVAASTTGVAGKTRPAPEVQELQPLAVYCSHRNPQAMELIRLDAARRTAKLVRSGPAISPAWSRDGRHIAFVEANSAVCVVDEDGENIRNLTNDDFRLAGTPTWSPDGSQIAFVATKDASAWSLYLISAEGGTPKTVVKSVGGKASPAWSPDGAHIAFVASRKDRPAAFDLVMTDPAGAAVQRIRENVPFDAAPSWSQDSAQIVFADWGKKADQRGLVITMLDGTMLTQVTAREDFDVFPAWSPDGSLIAYIHRRPTDDNRGDLAIYDVAKGTSRIASRGTLGNGEESRPAWGPLTGRPDGESATHN